MPSPPQTGKLSNQETESKPRRGRPGSRAALHRVGRWVVGFLLLLLTHPLTWQWSIPGNWFPSAGVGFLLTAWLGPRAAGLPVLSGLLVVLSAWLTGTPLPWGQGATGLALGALAGLLSGLECWTAWQGYFRLGRGLRSLVEPRSATMFLVLVPGALTFVFAVVHALLQWHAVLEPRTFWELTRSLWFSRALGMVTLVPPLLVLASPLLTRRGWIEPEPVQANGSADSLLPLALGGWIEIIGLAMSTGFFGLFLTLIHAEGDWSTSPLAMLPLLFIIWASLRQGVRGGTLVATAMALPSLTLLSMVRGPDLLLAVQANLLAQCSTALLVGVSFNWIRSSEARYRHVVDHVPVVLYSARLVTPDGPNFWPESVEVIFVSPASRQVLGRDPDSLLGEYQTWLDSVHPEDHELLQAALAQLVRFKESVSCEYRLAEPAAGQRALPQPHGTGTRARWVRDTFVPQLDEAGEVAGWEGAAEDITPQRTLADDLRRTTSMLHTLVNNLPAGVYFVDAGTGQPILVNARARQLLGQREELSAGLTRLGEVFRLHRPDGTPYPAEDVPVWAALKRGTTCVSDNIVVHRPDGLRVPLVSWATPIDLGGLGRYDAVVWVLEDLTTLRQAENALRESETRLRTVIENMAEGVLILDEKCQVLDCNPAVATVLGRSADTVRGRALAEVIGQCLRADGTLLPPEEGPAAVCAGTRQPVKDVVIGLCGAEPLSEAAVSGARAKARWLRVRALPYSPPGARTPPRIILIFTDVTAQFEAQAGLLRLEAGLEQMQRQGLIGQVAGGVAHDFNNYLTVVLTGTDLAGQELPAGGDAAREELRHVAQAAEKAGELARQLTNLTKSQQPSMRLLDANYLVQQTLELLGSTLGREIRVDRALAAQPLPVQGNETQLQQVLINLCLNARDAMPSGGRLELATRLAGDPAEQRRVYVSVADSGPGLREEVRRNLFITPVSDKPTGAGLGLWMTRRIVEAHGGRIVVRCEPDQGTRVEIDLPLATAG